MMYKGKFVSELSMNEVKEYYDELRQKCPLTNEQWEDLRILKEKLIAFAYKVLDGKTNDNMADITREEAINILAVSDKSIISETMLTKAYLTAIADMKRVEKLEEMVENLNAELASKKIIIDGLTEDIEKVKAELLKAEYDFYGDTDHDEETRAMVKAIFDKYLGE